MAWLSSLPLAPRLRPFQPPPLALAAAGVGRTAASFPPASWDRSISASGCCFAGAPVEWNPRRGRRLAETAGFGAPSPAAVQRTSGGQQQTGPLNEDLPGVENITRFSYKELDRATARFDQSNKIGEGGYGPVYKGTLRDGTAVAVKVLSLQSRQGAREFLSELITISDISHENLVKLYGCCVEGSHKILVYNYLENNSLAQTLLGSQQHSSIQFNWSTRVNICIGVAQGLAYLHDGVRPHVVHRDIKASNILLDQDLTPKISDFGLAKLLPSDVSHISTRVAGTLGYLAPEYAIRGQVTRKSDVYSFGVLLIEIVSGRCNTDTKLPYEDQILLEKTWAYYDQGQLDEIIDSSLGDDLDVDEACRFLKVGLLCTKNVTKRRPDMSMVTRMLKGEEDVESHEITKPDVIRDFRDLKLRSKATSSSLLTSIVARSSPSSSSSTGNTTRTSITFTAISDRP
ncbi:cold-responsive protein kinase 1 isoform X2 [Aegilops tauschii subsp. strangulata]|uniref:Putative LRR receptor-like serine/threonine-protein kinase n=2 Tax=Triticinae TaxID=1648030 RepID=M8C9V7_AEGTA